MILYCKGQSHAYLAPSLRLSVYAVERIELHVCDEYQTGVNAARCSSMCVVMLDDAVDTLISMSADAHCAVNSAPTLQGTTTLSSSTGNTSCHHRFKQLVHTTSSTMLNL
jgi:hypothetical protein